MHIYINNI